MTYEEYMNLVRDRGPFASEGDPGKTVRAVLEVLGERISSGQADDMIRSLPSELGPYLRQTREAEPLSLSDFLMRISSREDADLTTAEEHARAVLSVFAEAVPNKELEDMFQQIPKSMRALFEVPGTDYDRMVERISKLDFIKNRETADAAVKAVLGILASRLDEDQAKRLTGKLPQPLTLERLRGQEKRIEPISVDYYISSISAQFKINKEQAHILVRNVLHLAKEATGDAVFTEIEKHLPSDWAEALEAA